LERGHIVEYDVFEALVDDGLEPKAVPAPTEEGFHHPGGFLHALDSGVVDLGRQEKDLNGHAGEMDVHGQGRPKQLLDDPGGGFGLGAVLQPVRVKGDVGGDDFPCRPLHELHAEYVDFSLAEELGKTGCLFQDLFRELGRAFPVPLFMFGRDLAGPYGGRFPVQFGQLAPPAMAYPCPYQRFAYFDFHVRS
jgi:hypothetical protein